MAEHWWILEVSGDPARWGWRPEKTCGLSFRAYESKAAAKADLYNKRQLYGHARLVKFVREREMSGERNGGKDV